MLSIRPISDLSRNMAEIERLAIEEGQIVQLAKNSKEHMVIMGSDTFKSLFAKLSMYESLLVSEAQIRQGKSQPLESAREKSDKKFQEKLDAFNAAQKIHG
ncbi:hypothetical protein [Acetonema longum]|uniref:Antitoxin n=1 Tax=Acetonema longum DSM 6540 TaxID=1009370 RepID=F7NNC7_9FIRM|nr:hypothetical protein [Acetonema longum]EGO62453.1 hypothetical protein ALO_18085 [Acetonema longum DSM 6540]